MANRKSPLFFSQTSVGINGTCNVRSKTPSTGDGRKNSNADKTIAEWEEALNPDLTNELLSDSELRDLGDFL